MKIILINGSSTPLYEQIKNAIKENIVGNTVLTLNDFDTLSEKSQKLN